MRRTLEFLHRSRRAGLGLCLGLALLSSSQGAAMAQDEPSYAEQAKATIIQLLANRAFKPQSGCDRGAPCAGLMAELRAGQFTVVEPAEQSDRADMPIYLRARKTCSRLDPAQVVLSHHTFRATRDFAIYRLDLARAGRRHGEILVFRGLDYVARDGASAADGRQTPLLPGAFVVFSLPGCRFLATVPAEDGDRFAKHNVVETGDHASELIRLDDRYFVINLTPVAGPRQDKAIWWYTLDLWDLGITTAAPRRLQPHDYSFAYRPGAAADMSRTEAPRGPAG